MSDGMQIMMPASEYRELENRIEQLEKALDKACERLVMYEESFLTLVEKEVFHSLTKEQWKEWCFEKCNIVN